MFTARQFHPNQKADFLKTFPEESWAAARLLGNDVKHLTFSLASVFHEPGGLYAGVQISFKTRAGLPVWVEVMGGEARKVLDRRGSAEEGDARAGPTV